MDKSRGPEPSISVSHSATILLVAIIRISSVLSRMRVFLQYVSH